MNETVEQLTETIHSRTVTRRGLLATGGVLAVTAVAGRALARSTQGDQAMEQAQALPTFGRRKEVLLSETGGDRATAYTMSNKILRVRDKLFCSWLGSHRLNHWAVVD